MNNKSLLHSEQFDAGRRTYIFDLKVSEQETPYLVITERKALDGEGHYRQRNLILFHEDFKQFAHSLSNCIAKVPKEVELQDRQSHVAQVRESYPNAYQAWSKEDDLALEVLFGEGQSVAELSKHFQRQPGAIRARIKRLGLVVNQEVA